MLQGQRPPAEWSDEEGGSLQVNISLPVAAERSGGLGEATAAGQKDVGHAALLPGCVFPVILTGWIYPLSLLYLKTGQAVGSDSTNQFRIHWEFLSTHMS